MFEYFPSFFNEYILALIYFNINIAIFFIEYDHIYYISFFSYVFPLSVDEITAKVVLPK